MMKYQQAEEKEDVGRLLGVLELDVSDADSVKEAFRRTREELQVQRLDLLINNAGIATDKHPDEQVLEATPEDMQRVFNTNVVGPMLVTQTFYPLLDRPSSAARKPRVVNVSSRMGSISLYEGRSRGWCTVGVFGCQR